jgi:DNA-directed RNA polymerase subunit M/transcription elongation factor TFIIS
MYFCTKCDNMYYIKVDEDDSNKLIHYCRRCGYEDSTITSDDVCVLNTHIKRSEDRYNQVINSYTKDDATLPRSSTIRCPNSKCPSNTEGKSREVIYLRYDDVKLSYIYMCAHCETTWKTNAQA